MRSITTAFFLAITVSFLSCNFDKEDSTVTKYLPVDNDLYQEILLMDKEYFNAYNTCDLEKQASIYADDLEFFHDKGGLMTSKTDLIAALKENICDKVTRELIPGSIEVYPIPGYGAVQMGYHKFHNKLEPGAQSLPSKFIVVWKQEERSWKITKVISLHSS